MMRYTRDDEAKEIGIFQPLQEMLLLAPKWLPLGIAIATQTSAEKKLLNGYSGRLSRHVSNSIVTTRDSIRT